MGPELPLREYSAQLRRDIECVGAQGVDGDQQHIGRCIGGACDRRDDRGLPSHLGHGRLGADGAGITANQSERARFRREFAAQLGPSFADLVGCGLEAYLFERAQLVLFALPEDFEQSGNRGSRREAPHCGRELSRRFARREFDHDLMGCCSQDRVAVVTQDGIGPHMKQARVDPVPQGEKLAAPVQPWPTGCDGGIGGTRIPVCGGRVGCGRLTTAAREQTQAEYGKTR